MYIRESRASVPVCSLVDVGPHDHQSWMSTVQKGLDLVIEVHVAGDADKDFERNVLRYAHLRIPEYPYRSFDPPHELAAKRSMQRVSRHVTVLTLAAGPLRE